MLRREFFKRLALLATTLPLALFAKRREERGWVKLTTLHVAGLLYGEMAEYRFSPDEELKAVREPDNPYDTYAVALYKEKRKVGYIPRTNSRIVASLLDSSFNLRVRVRYFEGEKEPWNRLWVSIWLKDERSFA